MRNWFQHRAAPSAGLVSGEGGGGGVSDNAHCHDARVVFCMSGYDFDTMKY